MLGSSNEFLSISSISTTTFSFVIISILNPLVKSVLLTLFLDFYSICLAGSGTAPLVGLLLFMGLWGSLLLSPEPVSQPESWILRRCKPYLATLLDILGLGLGSSFSGVGRRGALASRASSHLAQC